MKRKKWLGFGILFLIAAVSAAAFWFVGKPMLALVSDPGAFRAWIEDRGLFGRAAFVGMVILQIVVAFIPGEPLEIGAGYAFGVWEGTALCLLGATAGSALIYFFVRRFGMRFAELFFSEEKIRSVRFLQDSRRFGLLTFFLFLIPGTPKDLLSYTVGFTKMKLLPWLFISTFARIPSIVTSTVGGDALGMQDYSFAVLVFGITLVISLGGLCLSRILCRAHTPDVPQLPVNPNSEPEPPAVPHP